jgi:predicted ATPase
VASVLGVKEEAGHPVLEALLKCVNDRRLLLILDNCEHLVQACAELVDRLLRAGAGSKCWHPAARRCTRRAKRPIRCRLSPNQTRAKR